MRFKELIYGDRKMTNNREIETFLEKNNFNWLIDSEIENAQIEISKNTLIWRRQLLFRILALRYF